ncbi:extensin family protein [Roseococcus sp. DSY-14]|uniref:extensin-like domain-containing protein n=1 Tax=Roseococcus sp. DSY-14 TaxID=3369650 RepID=UPI00387AD64C
MRRLRALLVLSVLGGAAAFGLRHLPPGWDPRQPLDLRAAPGLLTGTKLARLAWQPEACFAVFDHSGLAVTRLPDRPSAVGCPVTDAVTLPAAVRVSPPGPAVTCRVAAGWVMLERHTLQQAARRHLGTEVAAVRHLGSFSCRNIGNAATGRRSEHATANALDVAGFVLRDGREVTLARDWGQGTPAGAFLREVRDGACRWFRVVLGPDYNAAHADHFHFDMGAAWICR